MTLEPLCDNILAEFVPMEEKTQGGLYIPTTNQERPNMAIVIKVGPGRLLMSGEIKPLTVKPGDKIMLAGYGGREKKFEGKFYIFLKEEEILAIVKDEA